VWRRAAWTALISVVAICTVSELPLLRGLSCFWFEVLAERTLVRAVESFICVAALDNQNCASRSDFSCETHVASSEIALITSNGRCWEGCGCINVDIGFASLVCPHFHIVIQFVRNGRAVICGESAWNNSKRDLQCWSSSWIFVDNSNFDCLSVCNRAVCGHETGRNPCPVPYVRSVGLCFDRPVDLSHLVQLTAEYPPTRASENDGQEHKKQSCSVQRYIYLLVAVFMCGLCALCIAKGLNRGGYSGSGIALLDLPLLTVAVYCFFNGFLNVTFP
jgi:hypothetical protein